MAYHELTLQDVLSCPVTQSKLKKVEPWLFEGMEADQLYPIICGTPIVHPFMDEYLASQAAYVFQALSVWGDKPDVAAWFASRYGNLNQFDPLPIDGEVSGEGYPNFWDIIDFPDFLDHLSLKAPEDFILGAMGESHPLIGLDLGAGQGGMTQRMAGRCNQVFGLETNYYLAALGNRLLRAEAVPISYFDPRGGWQSAELMKEVRRNATIICGDARAMPFSEPLFEWVHCGHFLDLVENPAAVIREVIKILAPGGWLTICSPWDFEEVGHFDDLLELLREDFKEIETFDGVPWLRYNHKRRFVLHEDWIWVGRLN